MKFSGIVFCLLALSMAVFAGISDYFAQVAFQAGTYTSLMTEEGWEFDGNDCFYGALLVDGASVSSTRYFSKGTNYNVWGFADEDCSDLDIKITNSDGTNVAQDNSVDKVPNCTFKPSSSGSYTIKVTNYDSRDNVIVFWGVMNNKESEFYNTGRKCANALGRAITFFEYLDENLDSDGYHFPRNQVCMIGGIMPQGETQCFYNFSVDGNKECYFFGFGSEEVSDYDIKICQQEGNDIINTNYEDNEYYLVGADNSEDAVAVVSGKLWDSYYYALKYRNYKSSESGFVFNIILTE